MDKLQSNIRTKLPRLWENFNGFSMFLPSEKGRSQCKINP